MSFHLCSNQCLALKFPLVLAPAILYTGLTCSVLVSLSHLDRTAPDYKVAFWNVFGRDVWVWGWAGRENITLKYAQIISHSPISVMVRYEKTCP